jgi:hypothetical protein
MSNCDEEIGASDDAGAEGQGSDGTQFRFALRSTIDRIRELQRQRVFAITNQQRNDRARDSFIAGLLGYRPDLTPAERKAIFARAANLATWIEREGKRRVEATESLSAIAQVRPVALANAAGRAGYDDLRKTAEAEMITLARELPAAAFVATVHGLDMLGLAVIVGEVGDLSGYANPSKLWKRLGLAPYNGTAAATWRREGGLSADDWKAIGFKPSRLGQIYGVVTTPLFFGKTKNKYGAIYAVRREHTALTHPEWSKGHSDNDGRRYITKRLLKDIWRAWREATYRVPTTDILSPANPISLASSFLK